jgi:hypothetical protein
MLVLDVTVAFDGVGAVIDAPVEAETGIEFAVVGAVAVGEFVTTLGEDTVVVL